MTQPMEMQGQYGGQLAPAATNAGGTALLSNLASGAFGMLSGGGTVAIQAALDAAKEGTTAQTTSATIGPQTTGNKVFNLQSGAGAMANNDFWSNALGLKSSGSFAIYLAIAAFALVLWLVLRRK